MGKKKDSKKTRAFERKQSARDELSSLSLQNQNLVQENEALKCELETAREELIQLRLQLQESEQEKNSLSERLVNSNRLRNRLSKEVKALKRKLHKQSDKFQKDADLASSISRHISEEMAVQLLDELSLDESPSSAFESSIWTETPMLLFGGGKASQSPPKTPEQEAFSSLFNAESKEKQKQVKHHKI